MKMRKLIFCILLSVIPGLAFAALSIVSVETRDEAGAGRANFSSSEKISFSINVNNTAVSSSRITFSFIVKDPSGRTVLTQTGNSAPGAAGTSGSSVRNIPVDKFFKSPGYYMLEASASLDGSSVSDTKRFLVSSPVIVLTYPPNGSKDINIKPLIFRWTGSGASQYRIYVGEHQSLTNQVFNEIVSQTNFTYPDNPDNAQHKLVSGQKYYWKVEGLGESGNVIAATTMPFNFTIKAQASRDVAIHKISIGNNPLGPGFVPVKVDVINQGSSPETDITVNLFINGLPVNNPKKINRIDAGRTIMNTFPVRLPEITEKMLITASHDLFDDNLRNNQLSILFDEDEFLKYQQKDKTERLDLAEVWEKTKRILNRPQLVEKFEDYTLYAIEPDTDEGRAFLKAFLEGKATVIKAQIKVQR